MIIDDACLNEFDVSDALFERSLTHILLENSLNYKNKLKISL